MRVLDNGVGMNAEVAAQSAEPFFTTKERGEGTRLGLTQVYGLVRQCQSEIRIVSSPGEGTTIEMRFPVVSASAEGSMSVAVTEPHNAPGAIVQGTKQLRVIGIDYDVGVRVMSSSLRSCRLTEKSSPSTVCGRQCG